MQVTAEIIAFYDPELYDLKVGVSPRRDTYYLREAKRIGGPILELGCGTGEVLLPIAEAGIEVVGVDISERVIEHLKTKLERLKEDARSRVKVYCMDMGDLHLDTQFEAVFIPNQTVTHLLTNDDLQRCFAAVYNLIKPGGEFIFDTSFPNMRYLGQFVSTDAPLLRFIGETDSNQPGFKFRVYEQTTFDQVPQLLVATFRYEILNEEGDVQRTWYRTLRQRISHPEELALRVMRCGFGKVQIYGDFERNPLKDDSQNVVIIAIKEPK